jgi:hypothetical protein
MSNPTVVLSRTDLLGLESGQILTRPMSSGEVVTIMMAEDARFHRLDQWASLALLHTHVWNRLATKGLVTVRTMQGDLIDLSFAGPLVVLDSDDRRS